jgi:hypothetical protein
MAGTQLNLQRNTKVFYSVEDLSLSATAATDLTPQNTWRVEVLAGYALSADSAVQDITSLESGLDPDRSVQRFNTARNPVEWNFQTYLRPTGAEKNDSGQGTGVAEYGNTKPVADWYLWQALVSNTKPASSNGGEQSVWFYDTATGDASLKSANTAAVARTHSTRSNFAIAQENHLYFKLDNLVYQVKNAIVNTGEIDASVDGIATTTWSGFGTELVELTGDSRAKAIAVFGGVGNDGATVTPNASISLDAAAAHHPFATMNVEGSTYTVDFIKNRLSAISISHQGSAIEGANIYSFPVTGLSFSYSNDVTYLTPEELAALNTPIGQFTGSRTITGSFTAYLRSASENSVRANSAQFLNKVVNDSRVSHASTSSANIQIGGSTAPYFHINMPAVQFNFPVHQIDDVLGISVDFLAQEGQRGSGDEIQFFVRSDNN